MKIRFYEHRDDVTKTQGLTKIIYIIEPIKIFFIII